MERVENAPMAVAKPQKEISLAMDELSGTIEMANAVVDKLVEMLEPITKVGMLEDVPDTGPTEGALCIHAGRITAYRWRVEGLARIVQGLLDAVQI